MLDAVDKVVIEHIRKMTSSVNGRRVSVFSAATADQDDQLYSQAGQEENKRQDNIELPFIGVIRSDVIDITDYNQTKRVHLYDNYKLDGVGSESKLTYYRCTLHYVVTIFAETRKISEDLATSLYGRLRTYCELSAFIRLPVDVPGQPEKIAAAEMKMDIEMGPQITQVNAQQSDKAQLYKCRLSFDLKNVNVYHTTEDRSYVYNVIVQAQTSGEQGKKGQAEVVFKGNKETAD
ncbi:MAG: hypothetical protein NC218_02410 [Acetobacter sp.]|nr:hypothetical protein [Acetobacter sp.]